MKLPVHLKRIAVEAALSHGARVDPDRIDIEQAGNMVRLLLTIATYEQPVLLIPADWWQAFKDRWFPEWLKKKTPVRWTEVLVVTKLPDLVPPETFGSAYATLMCMPQDEYDELLKRGLLPKENRDAVTLA